MKIIAGARDSLLSRAQVEEIQKAIGNLVELVPIWVKTTGDKDKQTSLRTMGKTDFFTKEIDAMLLEGKVRIAIHSAKDLPDPLPKGLALIALTTSIDPRDALVFAEGKTFDSLPKGALIATSSLRREEMVRSLRSDLRFVDLRGTIHERLSLLEQNVVDGVVVAEAALIRLKLTHLNRFLFPHETAMHQGSLAVLARASDGEMQKIFSSLS